MLICSGWVSLNMCICHYLPMKESAFCGRCSQMCRETLLSWRPLLSHCCGLLLGFIPVQDDIIVQAECRKYKCTARNPFIACLYITTICRHCIPQAHSQMGSILQSFYSLITFISLWPHFALPGDMWLLCCLFACRSWTWLRVHAAFYQQPREGKLEKEKQKQEKYK